ncbi:MAG: EAL domain-containing protein [Erysipelotrichales bacterium]|nr:EAL domain-containing protein [Erysipelotrichales bacterium]
MKKHTILLVEDGEFNRSLLRKILEDEYEILEAGNGQEALDCLNMNKNGISAIILDLIMPIMDGYEFIKIMKKEEDFKNIPILVTTVLDHTHNELEVLKLGAADFIAKPFNPVVIRQRVANVILLYENSVLRDVLEKDELTNLYNTKMFCQITGNLIRSEPSTVFGLIVINIRDFQSINNILGYEEGNALLNYLADVLRRESLLNQCVYGRLSADNFVVCMPYNEPFINNYTMIIKKDLENYTNKLKVDVHFGVYKITDPSKDVRDMCDLAKLASKNRNSNELTTYFTAKLAKEKELNEELSKNIPTALNNNEFTMFFQPKYDVNDTIVGLESVMRWKHPVHGTLTPEKFITLSEEKHITRQLDTFAIDYVCWMLSERIAQGETTVPISVNLARGDLYDLELGNNLANALNKYQIPPELLIIECKEEFYLNDTDAIKRLMDITDSLGIQVAIDNFGSTVGSMNALLSFPIKAVTINLRTVRIPKDKLTQVVDMLRITNCLITVLGIETEKDYEYVKSLAVDCMQGNYLSPALPYTELPEY